MALLRILSLRVHGVGWGPGCCRKENNGNDPTVNLISKGSGWGTASGGYGGGDDASASKQHAPERAIPAQPTPAWGGSGLPEERKKQVGRCAAWLLRQAEVAAPWLRQQAQVAPRTLRARQSMEIPSLLAPAEVLALRCVPPCRCRVLGAQVEMASQQEFPVLGTERGQGHEGGHGRMGHPYGDDPHRRPWDADERSYAGGARWWAQGRGRPGQACPACWPSPPCVALRPATLVGCSASRLHQHAQRAPAAPAALPQPQAACATRQHALLLTGSARMRTTRCATVLGAGPPEDGPYRGRYYDRERFDRFDRPLPYDRHFERGPPRYDGPPGACRGDSQLILPVRTS